MITKRMLYFILIILGISLRAETNAQSRLHPPGRDHSKGTLSRYDARVDSLLLNDRRFDSFAFTILPSFSGEQGCYYVKESSEFVLRVAKKEHLVQKNCRGWRVSLPLSSQHGKSSERALRSGSILIVVPCHALWAGRSNIRNTY